MAVIVVCFVVSAASLECVRGPIAACQAYILEMGGSAPRVTSWVFDDVVIPFLSLNGFHRALMVMRAKCNKARWEGIAATSSSQGCEDGLDWTVHMNLLRRSKGLRHSSYLCLWQGALRSDSAALCQRCQAPATFAHVLHRCTCWESQPQPPKAWARLRDEYPADCFWDRGLVPRSWTAIPVISDTLEEASGVFKETDKLSAEYRGPVSGS